MTRRAFWVAVIVALAVGLFLGYAYRKWRHPTLEERAEDAARSLQRSLDGLRR